MRYEDSLDGADDVVGKLTDALQPGLLQSSEVFEEKVREYQGDWLDLEDLGNVVEQHPWRHGKLTMSYDVLSNASSKLKVRILTNVPAVVHPKFSLVGWTISRKGFKQTLVLAASMNKHQTP